ncbi:hypothetical protein [Actinoplanes sp. N902-109]|uniref:hypothetical protein n=1 Tax=Actinoplanes sp. (strain N902-109) TaxID=649831 RepID=UPI0003295900|nr:hypothetical protein [Actinoplanes sp. N902-109]AGL14868.1 luciferase-like protein [Actinoplanes sp. N902-109]
MTLLGATFLPRVPPERLPAVARVADEAGLDQLWLEPADDDPVPPERFVRFAAHEVGPLVN